MRLPPFQLERYFAKHEFNTRYLLCSSDCESWTMEELFGLESGAQEDLLKLRSGYIDSRGGPELRQAISSMYSGIDPDQVLCFSGGEEVIFHFMHAVIGPSDEIIVHEPCYQALAEVPRALGAKVLPWRAREENGWALDFDELEKLATGKTRAIAVNLPHNPTGYLMPKAEFSRLATWAEERGIILFCDEVYRESEYSAQERLPAACDLSPSAISLGVASKTYGLAGLRIGWAATGNSKVLDRMAELKDYTTICNSGPSEFLAALGLRHREKLAARNRGLIERNLKLLDSFFETHAERFSWIRPKAGPIAFPSCQGETAADLCHRLVTDAGVLLLPGGVFGAQFERNFRIGFGRGNMPEALGCFEESLKANKPN